VRTIGLILVLLVVAGLAVRIGAAWLPEGELRGIRLRSGAARRAEEAARAAARPLRRSLTREGRSRALLDAGGDPVLLEVLRAEAPARAVLLLRTTGDPDRTIFDRWARWFHERGLTAAVLHDDRANAGGDTAAARAAIAWLRETAAPPLPATATASATAHAAEGENEDRGATPLIGLLAPAGAAPAALAVATLEKVHALAVRDAVMPRSLDAARVGNLPRTLLVFDPDDAGVVATRNALESWMRGRAVPYDSCPLASGGDDPRATEAARAEAFVLLSRFLLEALGAPDSR